MSIVNQNARWREVKEKPAGKAGVQTMKPKKKQIAAIRSKSLDPALYRRHL